MKGKRLYQHLRFLDKTERRQLLHRCKISGDKRSSFFREILMDTPDSIETLDVQLTQVLKVELTGKSGTEKDKSIRRFVDYCVKELEDLKLLNYLHKNPKSRMELLMHISSGSSQETLFDFYLRKTKLLAQEQKDLFLQSVCMDMEINLAGRQQKDKGRKVVAELLQEKKELLAVSNFQQQTHFYRLMSNLHLDDCELLEGDEGRHAVLRQLEQLAEASSDDHFAAEFYVSQARFSFFFPETYSYYIKRVEGFIQEKAFTDQTKKALLRRVAFLKIVVGLHRGESTENLIACGEDLYNYNVELNFRDSISYCYLSLFYILSNDRQSYQQISAEKESFFITKETGFYKQFLSALMKVQDGEFEKANECFAELSYTPNYYISIWSKLLQLVINYRLGNLSLCRSLRDRVKQSINKNKQKLFTQEDNRLLRKISSAYISGRKIEQISQEPKSLLHQFMLQVLREGKT